MKKRENRFLKGCVIICAVLILVIMSGMTGMLRGAVSVLKEEKISLTGQTSPVFQTSDVSEEEVREKYYYSTLTEDEKKVYQGILQGIRDHVSNISVQLTDAKRVNQIYEYVLNDFPDIFWCSGAAETTAYQVPEGGYSEFCPEYTYEETEKEKMQSEIEEQTARFLENAPVSGTDSEYDRIKYVYEYVIQTVDYDANASNSQTLYSGLVSRRSVCAGYARETQYLLEKLGIFCTYVTGTTKGQPHAWNLVRCEGNYYFVDTTWGDPVFLQSDGEQIPKEQQIQYDYLCCNEEELFRTHELDGKISFPSCTSLQDNYYVKEGCYYQRYDRDRMAKQLNSDISEGKPVSVFKFSGKSAYLDSKEQLLKELIPDSATILARRYQLDSARYSYQDDSVLYKITVYWQYE